MIAARRERVLDAAEVVLAEVGVTATMDEIAEAAGIGRRTLFRYFPSREDLIAAAIERRYQRLDQEVFDDAHLEADDPDELIRRVPDDDPPGRCPDGQGALAGGRRPGGAQRARRGRRGAPAGPARLRAALHRNACGSLAGGPPPPPGWLADAFGLLESLFTYQALRLDFGRDEADIVDLTTRLMTRRPARRPGGGGDHGRRTSTTAGWSWARRTVIVERRGSGSTSATASASMNTVPGMARSSLSIVVVTVAVRGTRRNRPISPNQSSACSRFTSPCPTVLTATSPDSTT